MGTHEIAQAIENSEVVCDGDGDALNMRLSACELNDHGNMQRFLARFGRDLLYVENIGWHGWTGTHWEQSIGEKMVALCAQDTAVLMKGEYLWLRPKVDEGEKEFERRRARFWGFAVGSGNAARIKAMPELAKRHLTMFPTDINADGRLLNVQNGTLVLDGACEELKPHTRDDLITNIMNVDYDPQATRPVFDAFLERVQPDEEARRFLQRYFGYCLTGDVKEQCFVYFWGGGANGKSTIVDLVARMMGRYAATINIATLKQDDFKRGSEANPDLARLPGVRFLRASEPARNMPLAEGQVKEMTGGEPITVRHLHGNFFEFHPCFKLVISGNYRMKISGTDHGIWRRVHLVPWPVSIPDEEKDKNLPEKLWAERSGVLNWMLDGLRMYLEEGLNPPERIVEETNTYRTESDALGRFLDDCVTPRPGSQVQARDFFDGYQKWCKANAVRDMSETAFGRALTERGFSKSKKGQIYYVDIQLQNIPMDDPYSGY